MRGDFFWYIFAKEKKLIKNTIISSNTFAEIITRSVEDKACFLDKNNILWKVLDNKWVGKRSVWTFDFRACWIEDTLLENVKVWWCGVDSNYNEIFNN